jgi:hypothetical protein
MSGYFEEHRLIRLDPEARNAKHCYLTVDEESKRWIVEQVLVDPDEWNDWSVRVEVDLAACDEKDEVVLIWAGVGPVAGMP